MSEIDDQAADYWEHRGEAELEIHLNPFTGEPQGLCHEIAAREDAIYGAFAGGGKDDALTAYIIATRLAEVARQRDLLLAVLEKWGHALRERAIKGDHCYYLDRQYAEQPNVWRSSVSFGELDAYDKAQAAIAAVKGD